MTDTAGEIKAIEKALNCFPVHLRSTEIYTQLYNSYLELREKSIQEKHKLLYANRARKNPYTVMYKRDGENGAQLPFMKCMACGCDDITPQVAGNLTNEEVGNNQWGVIFRCAECGLNFCIVFSHSEKQIGTVAWVESLKSSESEEQAA